MNRFLYRILLRSVFYDDPLKAANFRGPFFNTFSARFVGSYSEHWCGIGRACFKVFLTPCSQWLSPKNVALSVHSEVPPFCIEAVQVSSFPDAVDTMALSKNRKSRTCDFFTSESKAAPCIFMTGINLKFWKAIDNRSTERRIGRLKSIIQNKVDNRLHLVLYTRNLGPRAYLCSVEFIFNSSWTKSP